MGGHLFLLNGGIKMKKITSLALVVLVIAALLSFAGCAQTQDNTVTTTTTAPAVKTMTLVVGTETPTAYTVELDKVEITEGVMSVLAYLKTTEGLDYASDDTGYGAFLTKVGALEQADGKYIYLYTSVEKDIDVSQYATTVEFEGKTLTSAGVGASEMTIEDCCIIYIGTITF